MTTLEKPLHEMTNDELRKKSREAMINGDKALVNRIYAEMGWRQ